MSLQSLWRVVCDDAGCDHAGPGRLSMEVARADAVTQGWGVKTPWGDLCPRHAAPKQLRGTFRSVAVTT